MLCSLDFEKEGNMLDSTLTLCFLLLNHENKLGP